MKKAIKGLLIVSVFTLLAGCQKLKSNMKDWESSNSGLDRIVNIYPYGSDKPIATYEGKFDLSFDETGRLKFLLDDKRYIYYNVTAEVVEK